MSTTCHGGSYIGAMHLHHINPRSRGGTDDSDNLVSLCPNCHAKHHSAMYLVENSQSRAFIMWLDHAANNKQFICYSQMAQKLLELGYSAVPDTWGGNVPERKQGTIVVPSYLVSSVSRFTKHTTLAVLLYVCSRVFNCEYPNYPASIPFAEIVGGIGLSRPSASSGLKQLQEMGVFIPVDTVDQALELYLVNGTGENVRWPHL